MAVEHREYDVLGASVECVVDIGKGFLETSDQMHCILDLILLGLEFVGVDLPGPSFGQYKVHAR